MKDFIKIEITPCANGFIVEAHGDNNGKVVTETFACEGAASVMRRIPRLLKKLAVEFVDDEV
jgi:hypothetical protein